MYWAEETVLLQRKKLDSLVRKSRKATFAQVLETKTAMVPRKIDFQKLLKLNNIIVQELITLPFPPFKIL